MSRLKVALLAGACAAVLLVGGLAVTHLTRPPQTADAHPAFDQQSLWRSWRVYCYGCHAAPNAPGGVNLLALDEDDLGKDPVVWEKVLRKLRSARCRLPARRSPTPTYDQMVAFIESERERIVEPIPIPAGRRCVG